MVTMLIINPNTFQAIAGIVLLVFAIALIAFLFGMPIIDKIKDKKK